MYVCEELVARQQEHQRGRPYVNELVLLSAVDIGLDIYCDFIACDNGDTGIEDCIMQVFQFI